MPSEKELQLETLQALSPLDKNGRDVVSEASRKLFMNFVKTEPCVHGVFFKETEEDPEKKHIGRRVFNWPKFATAFVASALIKMKDAYKFHSMLKKDKIEEDLRAMYEGLPWKKIGFQIYTHLYPTVVMDETKQVCLEDYIEDGGHEWAERLMADITSPDWMKKTMRRLIKGHYSDEEYNRDMNVLFVKLHLLDPQSVIPAYQYLLSCRALPAVNLELATRNYLGGPFEWKSVRKEIESAVNCPSLPMNVSRLSLDDLEIYYGVQVDEFIVTECRNHGFWTGERPDNRRTSKFKDRCQLM
ncbi:uncharacterized protein LOC135463951 [Liolophura sinensis]|uniref:uncharacterized protein LOC135463951 n=1 Tax=Liolophura sinensis TaxID=3198878 RepID=UPI0031594AEC